MHLDHCFKVNILIRCFGSAVKTEEGNAAARVLGLKAAFTEVKDSVDGLVAKVRYSICLIQFLAHPFKVIQKLTCGIYLAR